MLAKLRTALAVQAPYHLTINLINHPSTIHPSTHPPGPALTTLGSPGCLTTPITVGAYVSPDMMSDQYSMLPPEEGSGSISETSYSFSSRGPTPDGFLPTLCAPGGAIAPVPRHTLQKKQQMHGTSMSSPNACGVAAVVLSALRSGLTPSGLSDGAGVVGEGGEGSVGSSKTTPISPEPMGLRRALENSARPVATSDPWAQGAGLISGPDAIRYAQAHHGQPGP